MRTLMGDPDTQVRIYGMDFEQDEANFVDDFGDEYEYDEFIGKWMKKRKEKRAIKRAEKGRPPRRPLIRIKKRQPVVTPVRTPAKTPVKTVVKKDPTATKGSVKNPITNKDLKGHKVINNAMQNELKTLQEEQKVEGLKKKVEQEEMKKENLKQQAGLMGAGKGLIVVVGVLGAIGLLVYLNKSKQAPVVAAPAA